MLTDAALSAALLDVGRPVDADDVAAFAGIDPTAPNAGLAVVLTIRARFDRPIPPPQVHRVLDALRAARG